MAGTRDWLKSGRQEQLDMARNWITILRAETAGGGKGGTKAEAWGVPHSEIEALEELAEKAGAALGVAKNEETRTRVSNAACKSAFDALAAKMRYVKKHWFLVPPLTEADFASLGLKITGGRRAESGDPTGQIMPEVFLTGGRHELGVIARYLKGSPNDRENKTYRYWYRAVPAGDKAPESPEDLTKSFSTQRKRDTIHFGFTDSGKFAWIAVQIENNKKKGPWGPLVSALIP